MSPKIHSTVTSQLYSRLENLREAVVSPKSDAKTINQQFHELEQQFIEELLTLPLENVNSLVVNHWEGFKTEINRSLRLLKTDFAFFEASLKAGKIPKTKRLCYNLDQLLGLCSVLRE